MTHSKRHWNVFSKNDEHHNNNQKTRYRIKNQNSKPQNRIPNQTSKIPNPKIHQNPRSKIQTPKSRSKSVETCLPNTCLPNKCVCPPVCPTASSPKAQTFEPPLTIHFDVLFAQFFLVIKAAVLHMEFCFMTGLPQESRRFFVFANSPAQWAKCQAGNHPKSVQSLAHKRFVSQKSHLHWTTNSINLTCENIHAHTY